MVIVLAVAVSEKHLHMQWGTPFDAFAAVGTVGALVWALVSGIHLRRQTEFDKRAVELEKHREQASSIAGWPQIQRRRSSSGFFLSNSSKQPVFGLVVYFVWMHTDEWHTTGEEAEERSRKMIAEGRERSGAACSLIAILPPGQFFVNVPDWLGNDDLVQGLEVAFTDASGRHWVRRSNGSLEQRMRPAIEHYGIPHPFNYRSIVLTDV